MFRISCNILISLCNNTRLKRAEWRKYFAANSKLEIATGRSRAIIQDARGNAIFRGDSKLRLVLSRRARGGRV